MANQKTKNNGESLSGKSVNRNLPIHLFTYSPIFTRLRRASLFTHSLFTPPLHPPLVRGGWGGKTGMTLIELVLGMVLIGIVALVVANALSTGIDAFFTTDNRKEALDQGRIAMDRMAKEIRNVRSSSAADLSVATATTFTFVDTEGTTISFALGGGNITRNADTLAIGISNQAFPSGIFTYVLSTGTETQAPSAAERLTIKLIKIDFKATAGTESVSLQTEVWPRNL